MFNKINKYILKNFLFSFIIVFLIFAIILFVGDFVEQFRKAAGKDVSVRIIFQLAAYNFPSLISFTLPITAFFSSLAAFLILIRNSETIVFGSAGISNLRMTIPAVVLYLLIGSIFVTFASPLISVFEENYSKLEYKYINKIDKFAAITKNGIWLKQENFEKEISSVLFATGIKNEGRELLNFMILEYDKNEAFHGRIDGDLAKLKDGFWQLNNSVITPKYGEAKFEEYINYSTNIRLDDILDSLSSPTSISIWRLIKFINFLENLGYSAVDFKMHLYNMIFLPILVASLVFLSSSLVKHLKQNDKFTKTIIYGFVIIFCIYFLTNLLDALGTSSQIHPFLSKALIPVLVVLFSIFLQSTQNTFREKLQ